MNNHAVNTDAYEQYVDATVALFMEYYSAVSLPENIRAEFNEQENKDFVFPAALDDRCRRLIKRECSRYRLNHCIKTIGKGIRYVAIFAIVVLSLFSLLFMTVDAIRIPIINFYIEHFDGHWDISGQEEPNLSTEDTAIDIQNPLAGLISEDFQLLVLEGDSLLELIAIYEDSNGNQIFFSSMAGENWMTIDTENAQHSQECEIGGYKAIVIVDNPNVRILWFDESTSTTFSLVADEMSETEAVSIVEKIIYKLPK